MRLNNIVKQKKAIPFQAFIETFKEKFSIFFTKPAFKTYLNHLSIQLRRANLNQFKAEDILGYQVLMAIGFGLIFGVLAGSMELALISIIVGLALPLIWLNDKAQKREKDLLRELPNALEVLSLCSEAGLSLEQALDQYLRNAKSGPLKDELSKIMEQTRSGSGRKTAFTSVTERLNLTDFSLFATSVIQAERFGTGISKTLQQLSMTIRDKQSQRAEKAVQEMPVKLLFPLIFFIMPVTFLIIFGPIVLQFLNQ
ncbi:MAG TPA: type II secretion system F family protein [bacterium]|nr:type II secretion system F family protein [bacterium]